MASDASGPPAERDARSVVNRVFRDHDVDRTILDGRTVAIIGYGVQGRPQALCMRDSGVEVIIGAGDAHQHSDWDRAEADGFTVRDIPTATADADVVHVLLPDPAQAAVYRELIAPHLSPGKTLSFASGFNVLYGAIKPPADVDVVLYVPNSPGHVVREKYLQESGVYGAVAVEQDVSGSAWPLVLGLAWACGSTRVGVVAVDFEWETEGDNFEEQVLYGGTIALMRATYETLVAHGCAPHFAYAKAIRSLRSVVDVMDEVGIESYISSKSSRTCEFAVRMSGPRVVDRSEVEKIYEETARGEFAARWMEEWELGMPRLHRMRRSGAASEMERTGTEWRSLFGGT
jgi:ketol-acid reductoisomerase